MRILLQTPLSPYTGYGRDGIGLTLALIRWGFDVRLLPSMVGTPLPPAVAARLVEEPYVKSDLFLQHLPPQDLHSSPEMHQTAGTVVGWTMWEMTNLQGSLKDYDENKLKGKYRAFDRVFAYDNISAQALSPLSDKISILQGGYDPALWLTNKKRDWGSEEFNFCMVGDQNPRKNPFATINAFRELKMLYPEEFASARLHIKTVGKYFPPQIQDWCPGLILHNEVWSTEELRAFYDQMHVLVAASRGEGKNLPALEFMTTGGLVIASNWGGHQQWLNSQYAVPVGGELVPVEGNEESEWFEIDKEQLKAEMLAVFRDRSGAQKKGDAAARIIPQMCSWDAVIKNLFNQLRDQVPEGEKLFWLAEAAKRAEPLPPNFASALR